MQTDGSHRQWWQQLKKLVTHMYLKLSATFCWLFATTEYYKQFNSKILVIEWVLNIISHNIYAFENYLFLMKN